jgi:uncharacterized membrane protein
VLALLLAAGSSAAPPEPNPEDGTRNTSVYRCRENGDDPLSFVVRRGPGELALWLPPEHGAPYRVLGQRFTGHSGEYTEGEVTVLLADGLATLLLGPRAFVDCVEDIEASRWEHAKLSGHDYRAVADDGSWTLVLRRGEMVLHDAVRGERLAVPTAGAVSDLATGVTEYRGRGAGHTLVLRIGRSACALPDGVPLTGTTVTVVVDGERRAGCGAPLH